MPQNVGSIEDLIRQTDKDDTLQWSRSQLILGQIISVVNKILRRH